MPAPCPFRSTLQGPSFRERRGPTRFCVLDYEGATTTTATRSGPLLALADQGRVGVGPSGLRLDLGLSHGANDAAGQPLDPDRRRRVMRCDTGRVAARLHKVGLELCRIDAAEFRPLR